MDRLTEEKAEVERERDEMAPKAAFVDEHVEDVRMTLARFGGTCGPHILTEAPPSPDAVDYT